jgi:hypothetical protein
MFLEFNSSVFLLKNIVFSDVVEIQEFNLFCKTAISEFSVSISFEDSINNMFSFSMVK